MKRKKSLNSFNLFYTNNNNFFLDLNKTHNNIFLNYSNFSLLFFFYIKSIFSFFSFFFINSISFFFFLKKNYFNNRDKFLSLSKNLGITSLELFFQKRHQTKNYTNFFFFNKFVLFFKHIAFLNYFFFKLFFF